MKKHYISPRATYLALLKQDIVRTSTSLNLMPENDSDIPGVDWKNS